MKKFILSNTLNECLVVIAITAGLLGTPSLGRALRTECPNPGQGALQGNGICCSLQGVSCDHNTQWYFTSTCNNVVYDGGACEGAPSSTCGSYTDNYGPCT